MRGTGCRAAEDRHGPMIPDSTPPLARADWALFLDVDGTLVEIAAAPDAVRVPDALIALLARLERGLGGALALVSGRTIATLDHMLEGRLTINIISSDFPGEKADSAFRYQRSREVVEILLAQSPAS